MLLGTAKNDHLKKQLEAEIAVLEKISLKSGLEDGVQRTGPFERDHIDKMVKSVNTNYCANFIDFEASLDRFLRDHHSDFLVRGFLNKDDSDKAHYKAIVEKIKCAEKFQFHDVESNSSENGIQQSIDVHVANAKLPYDLMVLEHRLVNAEGIHIPCLILCEQFSDRIEFEYIYRIEGFDQRVPKNYWVVETIKPLQLQVEGGTVEVKYDGLSHITHTKLKQLRIDNANEVLCILLKFLATLASSDTQMVEGSIPDVKLNESRMKKGQTPLFTYKILTNNHFGHVS